MRKTTFMLAFAAIFVFAACGGGSNGGASGNGMPPAGAMGSGVGNDNLYYANTGKVSGTVVDKNGVAISGVTITGYHTNSHVSVTAATDANGAYTLTGMATGSWTDYEIRAEKAGFGFYPSISGGTGEVIKSDYNGLYRTVIHFPSIPATGLTGANFTASRPGDKVVSVPRTGQTTSYLPGDDASANKGVAWPGRRFTDNQNGTVTDGLTGLVWMKNAGCFSQMNWFAALTAANQLASGACGLTDGSTAGQWRMPNVNELESLVDVSRSNPALSAGNPFTNVASAYWSSTPYTATFGANAMVIRFTDGRWINGIDAPPYNNATASSLNSLWAVKSGGAGAVMLQATGSYMIYAAGDDASHMCPLCTLVVNGYWVHSNGDGASLMNSAPLTFPRFIDVGNGTLADTVTGLIWLKKGDCINSTWPGAITAINNLASGQCGLTDGSTAGQWRMPNRFEMLSMSDRAPTFPQAAYFDGMYQANSSIDGPVVSTNFIVSAYYWTSTTDAADVSQAWTVYSCDFGAYNIVKTDTGYSLAVR